MLFVTFLSFIGVVFVLGLVLLVWGFRFGIGCKGNCNAESREQFLDGYGLLDGYVLARGEAV